jgi:acyl-CoA synthetase (AMP-forming)/AMP-acid ligase II
MTRDVVTTVLAVAAGQPDQIAVIEKDGTTTTYGELRRQILAVRHGLREQGLREGEGVLFALRDSATAVAVFLGIMAAGGVAIMADSSVGPALADARMRVADPRWMVAESAIYPANVLGPLRALLRRRGVPLPDLRSAIADRAMRHVYSGRRWPGIPRGAARLADLLAGPAPEPDGEPRAGAPALVIFTSGTTSRPKGVLHTVATVSEAMVLVGEQFPFRPGDVMHMSSFIQGMPALVGGATLSFPDPDPRRFVEQAAARRATHVYGVPVHIAEICAANPRFPDHVRYVLMGSAPAAPAVLRRAVAAAPSATVYSVYAMTEAIPLAVATAQEKLAHTESGRPGDLLGMPVRGVRTRIADDGELLVSGPNVCRGYVGEQPLRELPTGDLARIDDDGKLIMLGRKKDMLIRGSYNIYPGLYEPTIALLPGVREAAIVGLPDPETEDEIVVLAVVAESDADAAALPRRLRKVLPGLIDAEAVPDRIVVLPELPRSGRSRKLDRSGLRMMLAGEPV